MEERKSQSEEKLRRFTYANICDFLDKSKRVLSSILRDFDEDLADLRVNNKVPIYSTVFRPKRPDSLYLKVKRKGYKYSHVAEVTDIAGFRVLCLFASDVPAVNMELLKLFDKLKYVTTEANVYWPKEERERFEGAIKLHFESKHKPSPNMGGEKRLSGYKSIHYVVETDKVVDTSLDYRKVGKSHRYQMEIQLRTLLQDVWGEMEHKLNYKKGYGNERIKESFKVLASELENKDLFLDQLKSEKARDDTYHEHVVQQYAPHSYFVYDDEVPLPCDEPTLKTARCDYENFWRDFLSMHTTTKQRKANAKLLKSRYENMLSKLEGADHRYRNEPCVKYWNAMEDALIDFTLGDLNKAQKKYENLAVEDENKNRYVPRFRLGEVYYLQQKFEKTLIEFDHCERTLDDGEKHNIINHFVILQKLALTYWALGWEYIGLSIDKIEEAKTLFYENRETAGFPDPEKTERSLINSECYYYTEQLAVSLEDASGEASKGALSSDAFSKAKKAFEKVRVFIGKEATANLCDTAAWFCFNAYRHTGDEECLGEAKLFIEQAMEEINTMTLRASSIDLQKKHYIIIVTEWNDKGKHTEMPITDK